MGGVIANPRPLLGAALLLLPLAVAACGGGSPASNTTTNADDARLKWAACMRKQGIDIPDAPPQSGGGGARTILRNVDRAKVQAAEKACAKYRTQAFGNLTPQQRQEFQDAFVKFSACMRQHGVDLPTPSTAGPGSGGAPQAGGPVRINRNDPKFQAAMKACQSQLPNNGKGGGPGGFFVGPGPAGGGGGNSSGGTQQ